MDDLIVFLRARLDEREARARATTAAVWEIGWERGDPYVVGGGVSIADRRGWDPNSPFGDDGEPLHVGDAKHMVDNDPATVLADVEVKRRIIDLHEGNHECSTYDHNGEIDTCTWVIDDCSTLQLLGLPFAEHPDYRPEWAP